MTDARLIEGLLQTALERCPGGPYGALGLAAWRGREQAAGGLIADSMNGAVSRGEGIGVSITPRARAVLANGVGQYDDALLAAQQAAQFPHELAAAKLGVGGADRGGHTDQ